MSDGFLSPSTGAAPLKVAKAVRAAPGQCCGPPDAFASGLVSGGGFTAGWGLAGGPFWPEGSSEEKSRVSDL